MADRDAKVVIKQKDGSDRITIYPHTKADIVGLIGIPGSGGTYTPYTVNGMTVTTDEGAFSSILGSDGYVAKRVNWVRPLQIGEEMIAGQGNNFPQDAHAGDIILLGTDIPAYATTSCQGITLGPRLIDSTSNKIAMSLLPDIILGQLMYGGTITTINGGDEIKRATITNNLRTKLGLSSSVTVIDVINSANDSTGSDPKQYGYTTLEGVYFICQDSGYFGPDPQDPSVHAIDNIRVGDWLISTGSSWQKVDNTDISVTLSGDTLTVDGTSIQIVTKDTSQTITGQKIFTNTGNVGETDATLTIGGNYVKGHLKIWDGQDGSFITLEAKTNFNNQVLYIPNEATGRTLATREWIGSNYLSLSGGNASGDFSLTGDSGESITIEIDDGDLVLAATGTGRVNINSGGSNYAILDTSGLAQDYTYTFPDDDGTFALGAMSGIYYTYSSGSYHKYSLAGYADSHGLIALADSGIVVDTDPTHESTGTYLTATYSALKVNSKGIAIEGGQVLALCSAESGDVYNSVVDGGFYFLEDAQAQA